MNDLIQELKAQCIVREQRGTNAFNSYMVDRFDTEKFAELIVRECLDEIQYDDGATHVDELLPKHFGFEL